MSRTRSEKYRDLRDTISFDTQVEQNKKALKEFEERLNRIDPHLMDTVGNNLSDLPEEPDMMDTSHSLRPFGNVSSKKPKEPAVSPERKQPPELFDDSTADVAFPTEKPKTKEELKAEIRSLFREVSEESARPERKAVQREVKEQTAEVIPEEENLQRRKEKAEKKRKEEDELVEKNHQLINLLLWVIIAVLAVILLVIIILIIRKMSAGAA